MSEVNSPQPAGPGAFRRARVLAALVLFGVSFGYVEAAVVVYLRGLYDPLHDRLYAGREPGDLLPLTRPDQLEAAGPQYVRWLVTELAREAATLLMLAAVALAAAGNFRQWFAAFLVVFGLWDIFYYVFLWVLIGWPGSLLAWDVLFLLPVPWVAPVLAPVLVALSMVGAGVLALAREGTGRPLRPGRLHGALIAAGGLILVAAFCWDYRNTLAGGEPNPFHWPLFGLGELLGVGVFLHVVWQTTIPTANPD
jgi:hypothetical protein